ncbi:hypothetical protein ACFZCL_00680 [Streptomyces sp. NPDC008159]|uniref:hypothetical protein n=1 Tax=Streptomyces sp. NPDC008159 TaxID=3364817 RepID=UPI0036E86ABC
MHDLFRRICIALAMGLCLSLGAAGTASASPEVAGPVLVKAADGLPALDEGRSAAPALNASASQASTAAACPAPGKRIKTASDPTVYLVGPGSRLYYIPNETVYFSLWGSWDGIAIVPNSVFAECGWSDAYELADARLVKTSAAPQVYIWDAWYGYRWITTETVFNKYAFSWAKVRIVGSVSPISSNNWWQ